MDPTLFGTIKSDSLSNISIRVSFHSYDLILLPHHKNQSKPNVQLRNTLTPE